MRHSKTIYGVYETYQNCLWCLWNMLKQFTSSLLPCKCLHDDEEWTDLVQFVSKRLIAKGKTFSIDVRKCVSFYFTFSSQNKSNPWLNAHILHAWETAALWPMLGNENATKHEQIVKYSDALAVACTIVLLDGTYDWNELTFEKMGSWLRLWHLECLRF